MSDISTVKRSTVVKIRSICSFKFQINDNAGLLHNYTQRIKDFELIRAFPSIIAEDGHEFLSGILFLSELFEKKTIYNDNKREKNPHEQFAF